MTRPVVGICVAVHPARFGPWDQDAAMVPAMMVAAAHELRWLALLVTADSSVASEPDDALRLLDGLIVPDWGANTDRYADFSERLGEAAEARGLPVLWLDTGLLTPDAAIADYTRAIGDLFGRSETPTENDRGDRAHDASEVHP